MTTKMHCNLFKSKQMKTNKRTFQLNNNNKRKKRRRRKWSRAAITAAIDCIHRDPTKRINDQCIEMRKRKGTIFIFHQYLTLQTHSHAGTHRALLCKQTKPICIWNIRRCVLKTRSNGRWNEVKKNNNDRFDLYVIFHSFQLNNKHFYKRSASIRDLDPFDRFPFDKHGTVFCVSSFSFSYYLLLFIPTVVVGVVGQIKPAIVFKWLDANTRLTLDLSTRKWTIRKRRAHAADAQRFLFACTLYIQWTTN